MRTKWWHGDENKSRRCDGLISKKIPSERTVHKWRQIEFDQQNIPGTTIVFSLNNSSKKV